MRIIIRKYLKSFLQMCLKKNTVEYWGEVLYIDIILYNSLVTFFVSKS